MKKYIAILILILFCQAGYSQSMNKLFNDFAKQKNVTHVTVGPFLMKISSLFTETMGVKSIEVLSFEECGNTVKDDLRAAIKKLKDPNYETMVNANEEGNRTKVMVRIDKNIIRELVILTTDGGDDALIRIKGNKRPQRWMLRTLKGCSFPSIPSSSGLLMRWSKTRPMPKISCKMPTISCGVGGMN